MKKRKNCQQKRAGQTDSSFMFVYDHLAACGEVVVYKMLPNV
ncbi:MAG: hypothetical protein Q8P01_05370 [bacterium]|nr:hypothetical protein [bacterium]